MRFYNHQHRHYCGIDLHVKTMYVCILDATGQVLVHRNVPSTPEGLLDVVAPYREDLVVAAECEPRDRARRDRAARVRGQGLELSIMSQKVRQRARLRRRPLSPRDAHACSTALPLPLVWCAATIKSAGRVASAENVTSVRRVVRRSESQRRSADRRGGAQRESGTLTAESHWSCRWRMSRATHHRYRFAGPPPAHAASSDGDAKTSWRAAAWRHSRTRR